MYIALLDTDLSPDTGVGAGANACRAGARTGTPRRPAAGYMSVVILREGHGERVVLTVPTIFYEVYQTNGTTGGTVVRTS